jgi:hypothetical protein
LQNHPEHLHQDKHGVESKQDKDPEVKPLEQITNGGKIPTDRSNQTDVDAGMVHDEEQERN